jgi:hypothetical protein
MNPVPGERFLEYGEVDVLMHGNNARVARFTGCKPCRGKRCRYDRHQV